MGNAFSQDDASVPSRRNREINKSLKRSSWHCNSVHSQRQCERICKPQMQKTEREEREEGEKSVRINNNDDLRENQIKSARHSHASMHQSKKHSVIQAQTNTHTHSLTLPVSTGTNKSSANPNRSKYKMSMVFAERQNNKNARRKTWESHAQFAKTHSREPFPMARCKQNPRSVAVAVANRKCDVAICYTSLVYQQLKWIAEKPENEWSQCMVNGWTCSEDVGTCVRASKKI